AVFATSSQKQYSLTGSNGTTWSTMDAVSLQETVNVPATGSWIAIVSANVDLWTSKAGFNQDVGIKVSGGLFPSAAGQPEGWKESGGFAGTFSPNAAFVQVPDRKSTRLNSSHLVISYAVFCLKKKKKKKK